ncbi:MAG: sulfite exporter TauE/SafE family protein [Actinobacteria bacterium]|nr:sulfite exporter TauE/SafE family protein [Actinomycetota bacterium]
MSEPWRTVLTLLVGLVTGVLSGMFGVGGAVVSTPAIRVLGVNAIDAVGTTLPSILPSAISGTLRYARSGLIRTRVVLLTSFTGIATAVLGSLASHRVPGHGHLLMVATAAIVGFTAWRMARLRQPDDAIDEAELEALERIDDGHAAVMTGRAPTREQFWRFGVTGVAAGALSGLLGIGGGTVMVPAFSEWIGMPIKDSVANSLACVGILAVPSTVTHAFLGDINWAYAIPLSIAVIPGARLGAVLAIRSSDRGLRLSVAVLLGLIAIIYAVGELLAL